MSGDPLDSKPGEFDSGFRVRAELWEMGEIWGRLASGTKMESSVLGKGRAKSSPAPIFSLGLESSLLAKISPSAEFSARFRGFFPFSNRFRLSLLMSGNIFRALRVLFLVGTLARSFLNQFKIWPSVFCNSLLISWRRSSRGFLN